jgi:hypothetical protein
MSFSTPAAPSAGVDLDTLNGRLLLITVHSIETGINTTFGPKDAARCDIAILDGPDKGTEHSDTLLFPKVVVGQLRRSNGNPVLARMGQGVAKPGQKPPWLLEAATEADVATATKYQAWKMTQIPAPTVTDDEEPF